MKIGIIGMGYVGLPLALQFCRAGVNVIGIDIDAAKVRWIKSGTSYIRHIESNDLQVHITSGMFDASSEFTRIAEAEAVVVCVPTPLSKNREPDISFIIDTARAMAPFLRPDVLVVLESTTYPGTTEDEFKSALEAGSGMKAGQDFHLAFSPEREDPGNPKSRLSVIPKLVGGYTPECRNRAVALYEKVAGQVIAVSSCRVAEAAKLLENIFRSVNIALINELKMVYTAMGIDIWEVIHAAQTKPFGFMPFYPGPGLGGHCIPIDPFYLTWKAREYGQNTKFIELAGEVNTAMPGYVVQRVGEALNAQKKSINGSRILVVGMAYKPNVDDDRESPSYCILDLLEAKGAAVFYYDPYIPVLKATREHPQLHGRESISWNRQTISAFDLVIVATAHDNVNYKQLGQWAQCIVDTRNAMRDVDQKQCAVWSA